MKKSILLMLPCAMVLAACSGSNLSKGSIFNEAFMKYNFTTEFTLGDVKTEGITKTNVDLGEYDNLTQETTEGATYFVHVTKGTQKGLFSLNTNSYFVPLGEHEEIAVGTFDFTEPDYGFAATLAFVRVTDVINEDLDKQSTIYDEMGRVLFTGPGEDMNIDGRFVPASQRVSNEVMEITVSTAADSDTEVVQYAIDGSIVKQGLAAEFNIKENDYYHDGIKMTEYGHKELELNFSVTRYNDGTGWIITGYRVQTYNNESHKYVASFTVPSLEPAYLAGDYFVYQEINEVEERATDYDLYVGGTKYNVNTYRINYTNGAREDFDTRNLVFGHHEDAGNRSLFDDKGVRRYEYFEDVQYLRDDKTLEPRRYGLVLNDKMETVADVSGVSLSTILKVADGKYVDYMNGIIYNNNLEEISNVDVLIHGEYGSFGLVNLDGKVVLAPTAQLIEDLDNGYFRVVYKDSFKFVHLDYATGELKVIKECLNTEYTYVGTTLDFYVMLNGAEKSYVLDLTTGEITELVSPDLTDTQLALAYGQIYGSLRVYYAVLMETPEGQHYIYKVSYTFSVKTNY